MGCSLYWKPVSKENNFVGDIQLRNILEKRYNYPSILDTGDIGYLNALVDAGVEGANDLIEAIEKHNEIQIDLEC